MITRIALIIPCTLILAYFAIYRIVLGKHLDEVAEETFNETDYPISYPIALWWSKQLTYIWEGNRNNYFCGHAWIYKQEGRSWGFCAAMSWIFHPEHCKDIYEIYYKG